MSTFVHKGVFMFIGLMGVADDGALVTPSGRRLFKVPFCIAALIQRVQHRVAQLTWRKVKKK